MCMYTHTEEIFAEGYMEQAITVVAMQAVVDQNKDGNYMEKMLPETPY